MFICESTFPGWWFITLILSIVTQAVHFLLLHRSYVAFFLFSFPSYYHVFFVLALSAARTLIFPCVSNQSWDQYRHPTQLSKYSLIVSCVCYLFYLIFNFEVDIAAVLIHTALDLILAKKILLIDWSSFIAQNFW